MDVKDSGTKGSREPGTNRNTADAWKEVETRFTALSDSLVSAVRTAWQDEESQRAVKEMESGLRSIASEFANVVDEAAASPEGQRLRAEAEKTARAFQDAGEQMVEEARPQLAEALSAISEGLRSAADELNRYSVKRSSKVDESDSPQPS